jgi:hypothetical protein
MDRKELDRKLDEWLDRAAAEHGRAEIRTGLETRILANLKSRFEKRDRRFRFWVPVTVTVAAVLFISFYAVRVQYQDRAPAEIASQKPQEIKPVPEQDSLRESRPTTTAAEPLAKTNKLYKTRSPKIETASGRFLSSGLSDKERWLIKFVSAASEENVTETEERADFEPFEIPEEQIPEFQIPDFEIMSFNIEPFTIPTPGNEEPL